MNSQLRMYRPEVQLEAESHSVRDTILQSL
jgi:hypothetical protein